MPEIINHHFVSNDLYLKEFRLDDNESVTQHTHPVKHVTVLTEGCVVLHKNGTNEVFWAPDFIIIEKDIEHGFTAINGPAKGYCTHITECRDMEIIDQELTKEVVL